jgi:hypothetical protein
MLKSNMEWKQYKDFNYEVNKDGFVRNITTKWIIKPVIRRAGYMELRLSKLNKIYHIRLHKVIYTSWVKEPDIGMHIDHINGNRFDNRLCNLREVTPEENYKNKPFMKRGTEVNTNKLSEDQVMEIRRNKQDGKRTRDLCKDFSISKTTVNRICSGKLWKHLPILPVDNSVWGNPQKTGGMSGRELANKFGNDYFSKIAQGKKLYIYCDKCGQKIK